MTTIGVVGAGNIGGTLGKRWAAQGHRVLFGVRDPGAEQVQALLETVEGDATAVSVGDAIARARVVVFAIPGKVLIETVGAHRAALDGKIVIDSTNNVGAETMHSVEMFRRTTPRVQLFRAFNSLGWENFANPTYGDVQVDLFYCGDEGEARTAVHQLIADVGLRPIYLGGLDQSDVLDGVTRLWFALAFGRGYGRRIAFKLLAD